MEAIFNALPDYVEHILAALGSLVLFGTVIAKLTPSKKDDDLLDKASSLFFKLVSFLPTLGMNPNTKKLVEALKEAQVRDAINQADLKSKKSE
jgi:hypothetical protein